LHCSFGVTLRFFPLLVVVVVVVLQLGLLPFLLLELQQILVHQFLHFPGLDQLPHLLQLLRFIVVTVLFFIIIGI
jgi:hypothetical protein